MEARPSRTDQQPRQRTDPTEARLTERVIAVARLLLALAAGFMAHFGAASAADNARIADALLFGYAAFALAVVLALLSVRAMPSLVPVTLQLIDVGVATALTLLDARPDASLYTILLYPTLAAAYRWGLAKELVWAEALISLMAAGTALAGRGLLGAAVPSIGWTSFVLRAFYVAATSAAVGYLAAYEKRRRAEARDISRVFAQARLGGKFGETISLVLTSLREVFNAQQVLLVMREGESGLLWMWKTRAPQPGGDGEVPGPEPLPSSRRADYLFDSPDAVWHATGRWWSIASGHYATIALDESGVQLTRRPLSLTAGFLAAHPFRRLIGVSIRLGDEWTGRLFVLGPAFTFHREQQARFALEIVSQVAPAVYGQYLVRALRTRAETLERARIARELHDGVTQSLLGLEMELVVLHRRSTAQAPHMADDLARVHQIVRKEVITVRELMEGIRVGDVDSGDLLHHLSEMVDRFGRYTGIDARFSFEGDSVALTPHARRQVARIVHEALVNVRRHSDADRVVVRAEVGEFSWKLLIEDNGRGFPFAGQLSGEELETFRQGPKTIRERVRLLGGTISVESKPGFGSKIEIGIPAGSVRQV